MRQHHKWTSQGRTYRHVDDVTGEPLRRRTWTGKANQRNIVHSGTGLHQPWVRNGNEIEHAGGSVVFEADRQRIIIAGQEMPDSRIFVQRWNGSVWVDAPHGAPVRDFRGGEVNFETRLTFPDAPYQLSMRNLSGGGNGSTIGLNFRSPTAERVRFIWRHRGLRGPIVELVSAGGPVRITRRVGLRFRDIELRWSYRESLKRDYRWTRQPGNTFDVDILIGPFDVAANELLTVFPDTWGPNDPAAAADDGCELRSGGWATDGWASDNIMYLTGSSFSDGPVHNAWSWVPDLDTATAAVASIDAGTQILLDKQGSDFGTLANFTWRIYCQDAANPALWSGSNLPSNATTTVESEDGLGIGTDADQTIGMIDPIEELVITDSRTYDADNRMNIVMLGVAYGGANDWWGITDCQEAPGANNGTLTIEYTPAAGGGGGPPLLTLLGVG